MLTEESDAPKGTNTVIDNAGSSLIFRKGLDIRTLPRLPPSCPLNLVRYLDQILPKRTLKQAPRWKETRAAGTVSILIAT